MDEMAVRNLFDLEVNDARILGKRRSEKQRMFLGMPENGRIVRSAIGSAIDSDSAAKKLFGIEGGHDIADFVTDQPSGFVGRADYGS